MTRNLAASVRARLKQRADAMKQDFDLTLTHFGLERLLYQLSVSSHASSCLAICSASEATKLGLNWLASQVQEAAAGLAGVKLELIASWQPEPCLARRRRDSHPQTRGPAS